MSNPRNTVVYNPIVEATPENREEAFALFEQVLKDAPKPEDHPNEHVIVTPHFEYARTKITLGRSGVTISGDGAKNSELLALFGITAKNPSDTKIVVTEPQKISSPGRNN